MNELTFLDLSKNANHSLTQSRNHNIRHLLEEYIFFTLLKNTIQSFIPK